MSDTPPQTESVDALVKEMDGRYKVAKNVAHSLNDGDYVTALYMIDSLPEGQGNDALYLGIALGIAKELGSEQATKNNLYGELLKEVLDYCKERAPEYLGDN